MLDLIRIAVNGARGNDAVTALLETKASLENRLLKSLARLNTEIAEARAEEAILILHIQPPGWLEEKLDCLIRTRMPELEEAASALREACDADAQIRYVHGLPSTLTTPNKLLGGIKLGLMGIGECGLTALFMMNAGLAATVAQNILSAALFATANLAWAGCGGYVAGAKVNWGLHAADPDAPQYKKIRLQARAVVALSAAGSVWLALTTAAMRDQVTMKVTHGITAWLSIFANVESVTLLLTGLVVALVAFREGRAINMPGNDTAEAVQSAREELESRASRIQKDIGQEIEDARKDIDKQVQAAKSQAGKVKNSVVKCQSRFIQFKGDVIKAERTFEITRSKLAEASTCGRGRGRPPANQLQTINAEFRRYLEGIDIPQIPKAPQGREAYTYLEQARARALEAISASISKKLSAESAVEG